MAQEIKYPDQVINALGGNNAVAALFGLDVRVVLNWRSRGMPSDTYAALAPLLTARGLHFPLALFGQRSLVGEPTAQITTRPYRRKNGKTAR
jgi:hypothetical protein